MFRMTHFRRRREKSSYEVNEEDEHSEADFVDDATDPNTKWGSDYDKCKPGRLSLIEVTYADEVPSGRPRKELLLLR
jgi:hypothetical protein